MPPKKTSGEIGSTQVLATNDVISAAIEPTILPIIKEELERYFAEKFIELFNKNSPLGTGINIQILKQNGTDELDFSITCECADFLEVAEITPLSEEFGQEAKKTGILHTYEYSKWIWQNIISKKQEKYKELNRDTSRTILLLYVTHWQFMPYPNLFACLRSTLQKNVSEFNSIFLMHGNGIDLNISEIIQPYLERVPQPRKFFYDIHQNVPPGTNSLTTDNGITLSIIPVADDGSNIAEGNMSIFNPSTGRNINF